MSKRYLVINPKFSKKPKLDITISAVRPSTRKPPPPTTVHSLMSEDIFGDEDDEDCLIASQNVDKDMMERCSQQILINQEPSSQLLFEKFSRNVVTSTQVNKNTSVMDLLEDNKDAAFANIENYFRHEYNTQMQEAQRNVVFKLPKSLKKDSVPSSVLREQSVESNRNDANDIQVTYLMKKVETYKIEIDKLIKNATEFNDKSQIKDGEISMLRNELRHSKHCNETLRLEKMQEKDDVRKEWRDKINELEKVVKSLQIELDFKNVETANIRSRQLHESQIIHDSVDIKAYFAAMETFNNLHLIGSSAVNRKLKFPREMLEKSSGLDRNTSFRDASFQRELDKIQLLLSQIHIAQAEVPAIECISKKIIESAKISIVGLLKYVEGLEFTRYNDTDAAVEYEFLCQNVVDSPTCEIHTKRMNVYQEAPLFTFEKGQIVRRILAGLAIACRYSNAVCDSLVTERIGPSSLLEVIIEAIELIAFSKELYSHFGLIESLGTLLNNFIRNTAEHRNLISTLSRYLKSLIFCRPDIRPLFEISISLHYISSNWTDLSLLNSLCVNSAVGSFVVDENFKILQFSPESCPLQVYGALLEVALPQEKILNQSQIDFLSRITYSHIRFLRNCFERQVDWIVDARNNLGTCDCYVKITNSFVVLFHLLLKHWINDPKSIDIKIVSRTSRIGSLLLYDIFHKNYRREVLQTGGSAIKNRLHMIHDWLSETKNIFQFRTAHSNALKSIRLSHLIANPIRNIDDEPSENSIRQGDEIWDEIFVNFI